MYKVTYNRNADRFYTGGVCSAFFTTRAKADDFIQDLLYGWKRGGHSFDIDLDSIQIAPHSPRLSYGVEG
jgi:hypothetical protein